MPESKRRGPGGAPYPAEVRERAVRLVFDHHAEYASQWKAIESISAKLSINHETLRQWVRRAQAKGVLATDFFSVDTVLLRRENVKLIWPQRARWGQIR